MWKQSVEPRSRDVPLPVWAGVVGWLALVVLWATWTPIRLAEQLNMPQLFPGTGLPELVANLVLLAPLGFVIALGPWKRPVAAALIGGAAFSLIVEAGQIFLLGRVVSLTDFLLNAGGAAVAGLIGAAARRRWGKGWPLLLVMCGVFALLVGFMSLGGWIYGRTVRITDWDPSFGVMVGDEFTGGKRFEGEIREARICVPEDRGELCVTDGADPSLRQRVVAAAEASQRVDIHASVTSATNDQWGPVRIITFANGWFSRNITLGQEGSALVLRVRTPLMGENGRRFEIWTPKTFRPGVPIDVHARFEHGNVTTSIVSGGETRVVRHRFDALSSGLLFRGDGPVTPLQVAETRLLAAMILVLPLLLAVMWWTSRRRTRIQAMSTLRDDEHARTTRV